LKARALDSISFNAERISLYDEQISFNAGTHNCEFCHKVKLAPSGINNLGGRFGY